jgi:phosphoribosyl 1,2-cyclic phosphodiesterase
VEVRTPAGERIIIDGGTGLRGLGRWIAADSGSNPVHATLLLSHYHWDHIQGLPFCSILYDSRNQVCLYGLRPDFAGGMEGVLEGQMSRPYFPVDPQVLVGVRTFTELDDGARLQVGDAVVEARRLHHPQGCLGFRIETGGGIVVYASDNEPGDPCGDRNLRELARNADVLIYDGQYSPEQLAQRRGWGHSTWKEGVRVMQDTGAGHLILFHHDPDSDDSTIDDLLNAARQEWERTGAAAEGMVLSCTKGGVDTTSFAPRIGPRAPAQIAARLTGQRPDGSLLNTLGKVKNLTVKGAYLILMAEDSIPLHSEVELELSDWSAGPVRLRGKVVRAVQPGPRNDLGIGIVFFPEAGDNDRRPKRPKEEAGDPVVKNATSRAEARPA